MRRAALLLLAVAVGLSGCSLRNPFSPDASPHEILSGNEYPKLLVEVDHPAGAAPNALALDTLKATLRQVTSKSSVEVVLEAQVPSEPNKRYSDAELDALEDAHRSRKTGGDTAVLYILYVAGGHAADTSSGRVLGQASPGGSMTMFKGNIRSMQGSLPLGVDKPKEEFVERAVLVHEFGHVVGLVGIGAPMQRDHDDPSSPGHSSNPESVMYWQVESSDGLAQILTRGASIPYQYDADDLADLKALRES